MHLDPKDELKLSINGIYEKLETEFLKKEIKKGDIVVDVGANIGYYTLLLAKLVGNEGKVFAFEPDPNNFRLLKKNVEINGYQNVILENVGVSNMNGKTNLFISNASGQHRIYPSHFCTKNYIQIDTVMLDEYFKNNDLLDKISFIKIDVEGSELGVLKGMISLLEKNKKLIMLVEFVPGCIKEFGSDPKDLLYLLKNHGFKISYVNKENRRVEQVGNFDLFLVKQDGEKLDKSPKETNLLCKSN